MTSATRRRHGIRRGLVSAPRISAGLTACPGRRCRQAAISGGPASAAATTAPASHQPSGGTAVPPGTRTTARPAPHSAPGRAAISAPRPVTAPSCRTDPPLARSVPSSPSRRATTIRPASAITAAPVTARLTNSSSSTVCTADWVARKADRSAISGEVTAIVPAAGWRSPVSAGMAEVAWFRSSYSPSA